MRLDAIQSQMQEMGHMVRKLLDKEALATDDIEDIFQDGPASSRADMDDLNTKLDNVEFRKRMVKTN